ncbi:hypothetical protein GCM10010191_58380 [Actinomadura vinacea]|uniref:BPL/LPL catalytic domain-containing protein n=1 Tax=Actinomadura vinacea TaxID=115336 RepID=A0ABP5WXK0_9ACTN
MLSVIVDDTHDPAWNLALDEALARSGTSTLFRIWQNAPSVIVGRFQDVDRAVDVAGCAQDGVRVVRRASGGAAVATGLGTLNFTLVRAAGGVPGRADARASATAPAGPRSGAPTDLDTLVATAVERFGPPAPALRNGTLQTARLRTRHAELLHTALQVTPAGPEARHRVRSGGQETAPPALADLGVDAPVDAIAEAVLTAAADEFGTVRARRPNALERACRDYLYATRYSDLTWHLLGGADAPGQATAGTRG